MAGLTLASLALASLALGGCAASAEEPVQLAAAPRAESGFGDFLATVRAEALRKGIRPETLDAALADVKHIDRVIELDRKQPEFTLRFAEYRDRIVSDTRVEEGRRKLAENRALLAEIEKRYGVQPRFVVALWGIETNFGKNTGGMPVVSSLATLAYDGRRSKYFRTELMNALTILDQGHIQPAAMIGSWAGAMGQCQFMPSTFLNFAVDWDGDGKRNVWTNRADALASAANYLAGEGWRGDQTWGRAVRLPKDFDAGLFGLETRKTLKEWNDLGVRSGDGKPLPVRDLQASVVLAEPGKGTAAFLVYDNFRTIMKWNRSTFFALSVGHLADRIGGQ
ncbi:lytic transglycosylase domain-containing protein [Magnetospirillum sp. SS-4]|uniref:lytic murein transglycosylase n=1 Tax=Magnetospirillum sp. SS-4 TaxID=2681465 RepID=UPI00138638A9|nr:lytic murein transglycosylase [Magnetospirillum sp. SS-4]CAA7624480.1 Membrane-bound lytic murein transglycosylase B [Magnetospirillum sp. SS-4]